MKTEKQKERLELEKKEILEELKKVSSKKPLEMDEDKIKDINLDDKTLELADFDNNLTITLELQKQLQEIEIALEKIEKGGYGKCEVCGEGIEEKRLLTLPAVATCREHQDVEL